MSTFNLAEAKAHLSALVAKAETGEPVAITRRGKPVAQLIAAKPVRKAISRADLKAISETMTLQTQDAGALLREMRDGERY
ncbi:type II toxin-antitoxin system prevent-host-death family antitoxin [Devosia sp.]|uniref:type II toxin-antitoxin system Phd/YefM family antitoxin n=1 Tax=Devosia sp. TaxID=1871048 RepID=UPI00326378A8